MTTKERIEKDADELVDKHSADRALNEGRKKWYIAGATAERNKAIDEALSEVWKLHDTTLHTGLHKVANILESLKL